MANMYVIDVLSSILSIVMKFEQLEAYPVSKQTGV